MTQQERATLFRTLHYGPDILVLPNAWDAISAILFVEAGFRAIATTSAGIANSLGYPDGQRLPLEALLRRLREITSVVDLPVSADLEAGYAETPAAVEDVTRRVLNTGVIGVNVEDAPGDGKPLVDLPVQVRKIEAIRQAGGAFGVPVVINARTDVYWLGVGEPVDRLRDALARARAYRAAGADSIFIPGVQDPPTIRALVIGVEAPLNVLAGPGAPSVATLKALGVARVSVGSGPSRAVFGLIARMATELRQSGRYDLMSGGIPYADINALLSHYTRT